MYIGVTNNLKLYHRSQLVCQRLPAHNEWVSIQFVILDSMRLLRRTEYIIKHQTIHYCYASVGLTRGEINEVAKTDY
jgi:hypothetical protein